MPMCRRKTGNTPLQTRLVLHRFVCREFGYHDMNMMLARLHNVPAGLDGGGESEYFRALYLNPARARITVSKLSEYDSNIAAHSRQLRMTEEHGRTWKPHQYLALLLTEHYLQRYFDDPERLRSDLNRFKYTDQLTSSMADYEQDDLRSLAFQSATGSGKTLLMHAHILQYRHYLNLAEGRLNNIVLVTPNERMSAQHERDFRDSGLHARRFSSEAVSDLFAPVEIIDLNKLAEKKGVKRVAVADFGDDNLVLVDEGHLGASGKVWRKRRKELSRGGFTFEYSATFNQVAGRDRDLLNAYGRCLLFDYSYRRFHEDGYGKDYAILNLPGGMQDENSNMYLLGCLLTFYQQCRIWRDKGAHWKAFNVTKPLWVFLGKTVTGTSKAAKETQSDIVRILNFLGWVLGREEIVQPMIEALLAGHSGLLDHAGNDFFASRLSRLPKHGEEVYADLCEILFHGSGRMHVVYLTAGQGELHLRSSDHVPFGVVNVGDSNALYKLLIENLNPDFDVEREMGFAKRLFTTVDHPGSTVNVVIGARRFIAGWNSWRVSTMGLMHVGVGEGPEIIQMFGRGVRLKGWNMSLKRHRKSGVAAPRDSAELSELEKLYIFGLRANYMQAFRDLMQTEGMRTEQETVRVPVTWNFAKKNDLKLIRLKENHKYELSSERPILPGPEDPDRPMVTLDLYSRLQSVESGDLAAPEETNKEEISLEPYAAFFDVARVYDQLLLRKRQKGWRNLVIERRTVERLLQDSAWYELYLPPERQVATGVQQLRRTEDIAVDLLTEYVDRFWRKERRRWEHDRIEVVTLDENDPNNVATYELTVDANKDQLVKDAHQLSYDIQKGRNDTLKDWHHDLKLGILQAKAHAYKPLLHVRKDQTISIQPVPLNKHEKQVVERLEMLARNNDPCLQGKELFLIRNLTRRRGVSFFDDFGYYPDFIVWLKDADRQHVLFVDPKGLARFGNKESKKVQLHHDIAALENRVRRDDPTLRLRAYILSVTPAAQIDDGRRSANDWKKDGVYFLNESDCLQQVIQHALGPSTGA